MAASSTHSLLIIIICIAFQLLPYCVFGVRVTISSPLSTVTRGGILAIQCQVWDFPINAQVNIFRVTNSVFDMIINGKEIVQSSNRQHMFLSKRALSGGSNVYFLTIIGASDDDDREYICRVIDLSTGTSLAEDSVHVKVHSFPSDIYPLCISIPSQLSTLRVHDTITLKCTSEKGVPAIEMKWMNNKSFRYIPASNRTDGNLVHSSTVVQVDNSHQGALFSCEIRSNGFPDWKRTCFIGPIPVQSGSASNANNNVMVIPNVNGNVKQNSRVIEKCASCSSDDGLIQFYLTSATIGIGFLALVFLISTTTLCYKYHNVSATIRNEPARMLSPQQSIEPVYVSLQRRSANADQEYMTLEDPNNPDSKIIIPKETFDDYCKTMTLKRI